MLKTMTSTPLPIPPARYFRAKKVTWLWPLFAIEYAYPADKVTKRSVYRSL